MFYFCSFRSSTISYQGETKISFQFYENEETGSSHAIMDPSPCVDCRKLRFVRRAVASRPTLFRELTALASSFVSLAHLQEEGLPRRIHPRPDHPSQRRSSSSREQEQDRQRTLSIRVSSRPRSRNQDWLDNLLQETNSPPDEAFEQTEDSGGTEEASIRQDPDHDGFDCQRVQVSSLPSSISRSGFLTDASFVYDPFVSQDEGESLSNAADRSPLFSPELIFPQNSFFTSDGRQTRNHRSSSLPSS